jgi:acyl dehydratase
LPSTPVKIASADAAREQLGVTHGPSGWSEVTQAKVNAFADATGDHQWIHVDPERAASGPFGGPIAHGFLTLALIPKFLPEIFDLSGFAMAVNYGLDRVRFIAPVLVGSKLHATAAIVNVEERGDASQLSFEVTITADGAEKPSCVANFITRQYI